MKNCLWKSQEKSKKDKSYHEENELKSYKRNILRKSSRKSVKMFYLLKVSGTYVEMLLVPFIADVIQIICEKAFYLWKNGMSKEEFVISCLNLLCTVHSRFTFSILSQRSQWFDFFFLGTPYLCSWCMWWYLERKIFQQSSTLLFWTQ